MNINRIVCNCIRTTSLVAIVGILSLGFILPISLIQALVINPIILVSLMVIFAISNEKLQSVKHLVDIVRLPDKTKCKLSAINKVA